MARDLEKLKNIIKEIPEKPGVYRYYDKFNQLLYVGKAKNLKKRVSSYFQSSRPHNQRIATMVSQIDKIEYTIVATEKDSLILEANLINSQQPKFNVLLKDDKSFVYVRINWRLEIPDISLVRKKFDPKSSYFGPYTKAFEIQAVLNILRSVFPYCQAKKIGTRPCQYCVIKKCEGICYNQESRSDYLKKIEKIAKVLAGDNLDIKNYLQEKMNSAVLENNFALAALWRDRLQMLNGIIDNQKVVLSVDKDVDLINLVFVIKKSGLVIASLFRQQIRGGRVINVNNFLFSGSYFLGDDNQDKNTGFDYLEILAQFLQANSQELGLGASVLVRVNQLCE